jgi:hypothetical protein
MAVLNGLSKNLMVKISVFGQIELLMQRRLQRSAQNVILARRRFLNAKRQTE